MTTHHLKTLRHYFQAVFNGQKPFEVRNNDRNFAEGDEIVLEEYAAGNPTGRTITAKILKIFDLAAAQLPGFVAFTFEITERYNYDHLANAFRKALDAAQCYKDAPDVGTFNLDAPYIRLPGADAGKVLAAAKQADIYCSLPSIFSDRGYYLGGTTGHQSRRTAEAKAIADSLKADGYNAYVEYRID